MTQGPGSRANSWSIRFSASDFVSPPRGVPAAFVHAADVGKDGRVYFIFKCGNCDAGEFKIWRPQWQAMADMLTSDE